MTKSCGSGRRGRLGAAPQSAAAVARGSAVSDRAAWDKLVLWSYQTLTLDPSGTAQPGVLVADSWMFIPSAAPDRTGSRSSTRPARNRAPPQGGPEVTVDGRVTVADVRPPGGRWPVAATSSALAFQSQGSGQGGNQLEPWNPPTGKVLRRLPGDYPVASHGDVLAWCRQSCAAAGHQRGHREAGAGPSTCRGYRLRARARGVLAGREAARGSCPCRADLAVGTGGCGRGDSDADHRGRGAAGPCLRRLVRLGAKTVFLAGGRPGNRQIFEYRLGTASAQRLPVEAGDFFGMAAT